MAEFSRDEYLRRWSELHGGADSGSGIVRVWLTAAYGLARPLVSARVSPNGVTLCGLVLALLVPLSAWADLPLVAAALVALSGIVDNLDGAVAIMSGRTSRWGYVFDSVADRVSDAFYVVALILLAGGTTASLWLGFGAYALASVQEYSRARAGAIGFSDIGVVSINERPVRIAVAGMCLLGSSIIDRPATMGTLSLVALCVLGVIGLFQVLISIRSGLRSSPADGVADDLGAHPD